MINRPLAAGTCGCALKNSMNVSMIKRGKVYKSPILDKNLDAYSLVWRPEPTGGRYPRDAQV
ncbi:hypothetical protein [Thermosphaera sp.]